MKTIAFAVIALLAAGSAMAGGDKSSNAFVDTSSIAGGANGFVNGTSSGVSKSSGCTIQVQLKGVTGLGDGDQVICIGSADVRALLLPGGGGNSVVWRAPAKKGAIKIKNSVSVIDVAGQHCGSGNTVSWNATTTCYKPDATYDPATACNGVPGKGWIPAPAGTVNLLGLCQGGAVGQRIPPPSSGVIAETGMTIKTGAK